MSYDSSLLAAAPQATREMRQEGYNPYILDQEQKKSNVSSAPVVGGSANDLTSKEYPPNSNLHNPSALPKTPFYRTRKGIIIIAILAIVIIAAVIGGAVGGTSHKSHTLSTVSSSSSASTDSQAVQGASTNTAGSATATITTTLTTVIQSATQPGGAIGPVTTTITSTITESAAPTNTGSANTNGVGNGNQDVKSSGFVGSKRRLSRVVKRRS